MEKRVLHSLSSILLVRVSTALEFAVFVESDGKKIFFHVHLPQGQDVPAFAHLSFAPSFLRESEPELNCNVSHRQSAFLCEIQEMGSCLQEGYALLE